MSCCGRRLAGAQAHSQSLGSGPLPAPRVAAGEPVFEYIGGSSLTVTGPITGRRYHFDATGARRAVNRHDAASLLHVPSLRHIRPR
jgi:hypothetical protein